MMTNLCMLLVIFGCLLLCTDVQSTKCSPSERETTPGDCLTEIQAAALDPSSFWFGSNFSTLCSGASTSKPECENAMPGKSSIAHRIFPTTAAISNIETFLNMTFTTPPGEYTGCRYTMKSTSIWTKSVDPLEKEVVEPWYVRKPPVFQWKTTAGKQYTLIAYDAGYLFLHALYTNIDGNDLGSGTAVKTYHGPLITSLFKNPYVFMVFEQTTGTVTMDNAWNKIIQDNIAGSFTVEDFRSQFGLRGPIAVNWIVATGDEYAAQTMVDRKFVSTCPTFVSKALKAHNRPFIPAEPALSVWMDVQFSPNALSFTTCCTSYKFDAAMFHINPIGNAMYKTAETRTGIQKTITYLKSGLYSTATNFTGDMYTLITVDPDVPKPLVGTKTLPLVHELVVNMKDSTTTGLSGEVIVEYNGPFPPDANVPHYYYFLLYKHESTINGADMQKFAGNCSASLKGRCLYNVTQMANENNMTLVGASWYRAQRDEYVIYRNLQNNASEATECAGQSNYKDPCDTSAASSLIHSALTAVCFLLVVNKLIFA